MDNAINKLNKIKMKTNKDKLIDYLKTKSIQSVDKDEIEKIESFIRFLKSINPQHEPDGHRRLEDNKDKKEICPKCNKKDKVSTCSNELTWWYCDRCKINWAKNV